MSRLKIIVVFFVLAVSIFSQNETVIKRPGKKYNNRDDYSWKMIYDPTDKTIIVYSTTNLYYTFGSNSHSVFLTKLDTCLNVIWEKEITNNAQGQSGTITYYNGIYSVYIDRVIGAGKGAFNIVNID